MKTLLATFLLLTTSFCYAQPVQDVATLTETGKTFLRQGDYENAILVFTKALQLQPNDLELTKNLLLTNYYKRDFAKAIEIGQPLIDREDADVQSYQMQALVYKAIAEEKEADKLYKKALKKFPNEGVVYSEYGELLLAKQPDAALKLWEAGIEVDPNHSGNYYFAAKQYAERNEPIWSLLYGEMFINMESFTARSTEIKNLLLDQYKTYFNTAEKGKKSTTPFKEAVEQVLNKQQAMVAAGVTPEALIMVRTRFILDWYNDFGEKYPFRLFEHQRQLIQEGIFEAYNLWLFGAAANVSTYQTWQEYHQKELNEFLAFIKAKVFKVPEGQHYRGL